jgi:hypothetical protein
VVGAFATNHHPQVLPPYFAARKKNPSRDLLAEAAECWLSQGLAAPEQINPCIKLLCHISPTSSQKTAEDEPL